jgi:hypothetical protein
MADGKNWGEETQGEWRLFGIARNTMRPPQDYPHPPLLIFYLQSHFFSFAFPALEQEIQFQASGLPEWTFNLARMIKQFPNISIKLGTQPARASAIVFHFLLFPLHEPQTPTSKSYPCIHVCDTHKPGNNSMFFFATAPPDEAGFSVFYFLNFSKFFFGFS